MSSYWDDGDSSDDVELPIPVPNQCDLGGEPLPGLCELPEGEPGRKLDTKNAPGQDGATQTWQGYEPPELKLTLRMWRASHRKAWERLLPQILPRPGKPPANPFPISHVVLAAYGINLVLITKISLPKQGKTWGEVEVTITMEQFVKVAQTGTTTAKATATAPPTVHDLKGGHAPTQIGPPAPPVPPSQFNANP